MRIAVLGLGSIGARHLANAVALGHRAVGFDPVAAQAEAVCRQAGATPAGSRADALAQCDAVVVASPSAAHLADLAAAVDAGRHALVEKPFAHTAEGLGAILDRAEAAGATVAVAQNLRHHPAVERARALVERTAYGPVLAAVAVGASYLPDWRPGQDYRQGYAADPQTGGAIFDWVHEIDLLAHLLGPFAVAGATAQAGRCLDMAAEENAGLLLRHDGGALSTVLLSYATRPPLRRTTLLGPGGRIEIDIPGRRLTILDAAGEPVEDSAFGGAHADDYRAELADFVAAAAAGRPPRCPAREALAILGGVLAARRLAGLPQAGAT
ncbi:MAG: Gfo/Idh/MocA family oxidoreductase [Alphaproteobacteria bacterium]